MSSLLDLKARLNHTYQPTGERHRMSASSQASIAASLAIIAGACSALKSLLESAEDTTPAEVEGDTPKKTTKKRTSKKRASSKSGSLANIAVFKKRLFDAAEASGDDDVMPKLKKFIIDAGYKSSDKIEIDDREEFLASVKEHFSGADDEDEDEDDGIDI